MTLENGTKFPSKFSHRPMKDFSAFLMSMNGNETQAFAIDGTNAENVQTTGTKPCMINGVYIKALTADAELDISADLQLGVWAASSSYTNVDVRYITTVDGGKQWYRCIASHTSAANNKPEAENSNAWRAYWTLCSQTAENGVGHSIAQDDTYNYLALVNSAGTLTLVKADDGSGNLQIPNFEPELFCAIGYLTVTPTSGAHVLGTTVLTTVGTFSQLIGVPVFPAIPDKN
jgi:hypothetical protein